MIQRGADLPANASRIGASGAHLRNTTTTPALEDEEEGENERPATERQTPAGAGVSRLPYISR